MQAMGCCVLLLLVVLAVVRMDIWQAERHGLMQQDLPRQGRLSTSRLFRKGMVGGGREEFYSLSSEHEQEGDNNLIRAVASNEPNTPLKSNSLKDEPNESSSVTSTNPKNKKNRVVILIPASNGKLCNFGENLAKKSINVQSIPPELIVFGSAGPEELSEECKDKFLNAYDWHGGSSEEIRNWKKEIRWFHDVSKFSSPGLSRNAGMRGIMEIYGKNYNILEAQPVIFCHDVDEYVHPRWLELGLYMFNSYPETNVLIFNFVYGWRGEYHTPWCTGDRTKFPELWTSTNLQPDPKSNNVEVVPVSPRENRIQHGYAVFRYTPQSLYNISYVDWMQGEDGYMLQEILAKTENEIRYVRFPAVAYRSKYPSEEAKSKNGCECYSGFVECLDD